MLQPDGRLRTPRPREANRAARSGRGLRGVPEDGRSLASLADLPRMRPGRLLRQLPEPARLEARRAGRASADPIPGARRGLVVLLCGRCRHGAPAGPGRNANPALAAGRLTRFSSRSRILVQASETPRRNLNVT